LHFYFKLGRFTLLSIIEATHFNIGRSRRAVQLGFELMSYLRRFSGVPRTQAEEHSAGQKLTDTNNFTF